MKVLQLRLVLILLLATNKIPCIYMQNSGLSNALNPLISILKKFIPYNSSLMQVGEDPPQIKDEPQHNVKGKITKQLLNLLNINFIILKTNNDLKKFDKKIKVAKKK